MDFLDSLKNTLSRFELKDAADILILAVLIYYVLKLASETRAKNVLRGMGLIILAAWASTQLGLQGLSWLMLQLVQTGALVMVVLFQPELRRGLEQLGRGTLLEGKKGINVDERAAMQALIQALLSMAKRRIGALVVVQRFVALGDIVSTGTMLEADMSSQLLESIFMPGTPLHDGAVIVNDGEIVAAGCFLPLTDRQDLPKDLGTRHRAALGLSEVSDSLVFVVSEETGTISMASEGELRRNMDAAAIRKALVSGASKTTAGRSILERFRSQRGAKK